jgi:hypothetical protein
MKTTLNLTLKTVAFVFIGLLIFSACKEKKEATENLEGTETAVYDEALATDPCLADPAWFAIDPATGMRNTPAPQEGETSVFGDNSKVSNCNFHQWSWQKFLWLTNDVSGRPLFMDSLIQVNSHTVPVPTVDKKIVLSSTDNVQATGDILRTNKSYSTNDTSYDVYYSIHVDSTLYNAIQTYAPMDPSEYTDITFPVGALEVKIAWVVADAIEDTSSYFLTDAVVEGNDTQIALLGMHVVGIVYNHPEFVWATFEHNDLVPYYDWESTTTSDIPVTSDTNKLLFNVNATGTIANIASHGTTDSTNVFAVNQYGVPRQAQNAFLETSQDGAQNYNNIDSINTDVQSQLTGIWNNYFYNGSVWINTENYDYPTEQAQLLVSLGGTLADASPNDGKLVTGSVAAYNITMETYEQLGFKPPTAIYQQSTATMGNCFSCHNAGSGSSLNISHLFNGALNEVKGLSPQVTKQQHLDEIQAFIKRME